MSIRLPSNSMAYSEQTQQTQKLPFQLQSTMAARPLIRKYVEAGVTRFHMVDKCLSNRTQNGFLKTTATHSSYEMNSFSPLSAISDELQIAEFILETREGLRHIPQLPVDVDLERQMDEFFALRGPKSRKVYSRSR